MKFLSKTEDLPLDNVEEFLSKQREVWTGSYDSYRYILEKFGNDYETKHTSRDYLSAVEEEGFPWLKLPKMPPLNISDLDSISINPKAHPGYFTKMFFGDNRSETIPYSLKVARQIFTHLKSFRFKWHGLWTLGGRSKDIKLTEEYTEEIGTRAVWIPEEPLVLLSLVVVQPFTLLLTRLTRHCLFVGKNFSIKENQWFSRLASIYPFSMRCDWKLFDAHVDKELILAAMSIIRSCYPQDRFHTRYFSFLTDTIIDKKLVVPPGFIYKITKGMPSGHPLVTLVNTLINYIVWIKLLQKVYGKGKVAENCYALFSGDDTRLFLKWHPNLLKIDEIIKEGTHLEADQIVDSLEPAKSLYKDEPNTRFLKRYVNRQGIVSWHSSSMIRKLLYTDKNLSSVLTTKRWVCSLLYAAPGNNKLNELFCNYVFYLHDKENYHSVNISQKNKDNYKDSIVEDLLEAESVGLFSQIASVRQQESKFLNSSKYILENNERISISRVINEIDDDITEVLFILQGLLITNGRFSVECFSKSITRAHEIMKERGDLIMDRMVNSFVFKKFKLEQAFRILKYETKVPEAVIPMMRKWRGPLHNEFISLLSDLRTKPSAVIRENTLSHILPKKKIYPILNRKSLDDTS